MVCPICEGTTTLLDVVDFNKSCEEPRAFLPLSGIPVYYSICNSCDFVYSETMLNWTEQQFKQMVYNDEYTKIDPDHVEKRPRQFLDFFSSRVKAGIRHLDYGGGRGLLSQLLREKGWDSTCYDPFYNNQSVVYGRFDLVSAIEVFEHCTKPIDLMATLREFVQDDSLIFFTTLLNDGNLARNKRLDWWYASPRNGHVSLYSRKSLQILGERYGFSIKTLNTSTHLYYKPDVKKHLLSAF